MRGEEIAVPEPEEAEAPAVDLMAALKASVAAAKKGPEAREAEREAAQARKAKAPRPRCEACARRYCRARSVAVPTASSVAWKSVLSIFPW